MTLDLAAPNGALRDAIRTRNLPQLRAALDAGADPNTPDVCGLTPLHHAVLHLSPVAMLELRRAGANPNVPGPDGRTGDQWLAQAPLDLNEAEQCRWRRALRAWTRWCEPVSVPVSRLRYA